MKRIYIILFLLLNIVYAKADFVTTEQARLKALSFLSSKQVSKAKVAGSIYRSSAPQLNLVTIQHDGACVSSLDGNLPAYYIFNYADSTGFIIVSAESGTQEILAYSNEGCFNVEDMDKGAELFLNQYRSDIAKVRSQGLSDSEKAYVEAANSANMTANDEVLLETANFSQKDGNWSRYTPLSNAPAGCVATAMAIVMHYNQWPQTGKGYVDYTTRSHEIHLTHDFTKDIYNWSCIPKTKYDSSTWSDEAKEEIAKIQLACGISVHMDYCSGLSGAFSGWISSALVDNFSYSIDYASANKNDLAGVKEEIDNNRPTIVCSSNHCFVLDGYNSQYYHFNLGWGGLNNGWYTSSAISTDNMSIEYYCTHILPQTGAIVKEGQNNTVAYKFYDDGSLIITGTGTVPSSLITDDIRHLTRNLEFGEGITEIGSNFFNGYGSFHTLKLPETLETIGYNALPAYSLTSLTLPKSLKTIGGMNFFSCQIPTLTIPKSVTSIGESSFVVSKTLTKITVEEGNQNYYTTADGNSLIEKSTGTLIAAAQKVEIPTNVKRIGTMAFRDYDITSLNIPSSVTSIGEEAFEYCKKLRTVSLPPTIKDLSRDCFYGCTCLKEINIPKTVTSIGSTAFASCDSLKRIVIGSGVKSIGRVAFGIDGKPEEVICYATDVPSLGDKVFQGSNLSNATLYVPKNSLTVYQNAAQWKEFGLIKALETTEEPTYERCATPTIAYTNGKFHITSATEDAEIVTSITCDNEDMQNSVSAALPDTYTISAYAKKAGLIDSSISTTMVTFSQGEVRIAGDTDLDGSVDSKDVINVVNTICNNNKNSDSGSLKDVNCDGKVNVSDIDAIFRIISEQQ